MPETQGTRWRAVTLPTASQDFASLHKYTAAVRALHLVLHVAPPRVLERVCGQSVSQLK